MNLFESNPPQAALAAAAPLPVNPGTPPTETGSQRRTETHMNRATGSAWWHTPAVAGSVTLGIVVLIFLISISPFAADVSLMLRKLI